MNLSSSSNAPSSAWHRGSRSALPEAICVCLPSGSHEPKCLPAEVVEALRVEDRDSDLAAAKGQIADALAKQKGAEARIAQAEAQGRKHN
jgi:hypothetical protein